MKLLSNIEYYDIKEMESSVSESVVKMSHIEMALIESALKDYKNMPEGSESILEDLLNNFKEFNRHKKDTVTTPIVQVEAGKEPNLAVKTQFVDEIGFGLRRVRTK